MGGSPLMRKTIILCFVLLNSLLAQIGYVEVTDPIYTYLDRMQSLHVIENYNSFEIPKTRKEITKHLREIEIVKDKLNSIDARTLNDFLIEFGFELSNST